MKYRIYNVDLEDFVLCGRAFDLEEAKRERVEVAKLMCIAGKAVERELLLVPVEDDELAS